MSIDRWLILLTQEEFEIALLKAKIQCESVLSYVPQSQYFDFGDANDDIPNSVLMELTSMHIRVDRVKSLLELLFIMTSNSQQASMFYRFIEDNLGKGKIVKFWSE